MNTHSSLLCGLAALVLLPAISARALTIPSDGSDGALNPASNLVIDLAQATTGAWDASNAANAGKGRYDSSKWAVVYKYSSVNIPAGVTVTFKNHPTHAPVVWLVSGNVNIAGTLSVAGAAPLTDAISQLTPTESGPGGYRGGAKGPSGDGGGYGIGGASAGNDIAAYGIRYGNPQILPLLGGSGGPSNYRGSNFGSGGGGGAILIAVAGNASIGGTIDANGGKIPGSPGSGGAVRIIAQQVTGSGEIKALNLGYADGYGRIRIETPSLATTLRTSPETIAVPPAAVPIIWPADNAPTVRVVSIDGVLAPLDPTAPVVSSADVGIQKNGTVQVVLQTANFPTNGVVQVRPVQKYGTATLVNASYSSGNFAGATWIANLTFAPGFTTLQARATVP